MEERGINLLEYVARFPEDQHETVLKQVLIGKSLETAFMSPQGKAILSSCVDGISTKISELLALTEKDPGRNDKAIWKACMEIRLIRKFMTEWATMINTKHEHEETAKKIIGR